MLKILKKINYAIPPFLLSPLKLFPERLLFGRYYQQAAKSISFDIGLFDENLKKLLEYAREHTEYGREIIPQKLPINSEIRILLKDLPIISSEDLMKNPSRYISDEVTRINSYTTTTGGTGRNATEVCLSSRSYGIEWAHILAMWGELGYKRSSNLKLTFRGYHLPEGKLIIRNHLYNELMVDPFQLNDNNFMNFYEQIKKYPISCIHGYPSLIKLFMERLRAAGLNYPVKMIFLASEGATPEFKRELQQFFQAKILSFYGQTEKVILATDFNATGLYKVYSSYGYVDVRGPNEAGIGEIVGSSFVNMACPLINYRTGDYGKIIIKDGNLYLTDITGRWGKDFIYLDRGNRIPTSAINLHSDIQREFLFYQIIQNEYGKIHVVILLRKHILLNSVDAENIRTRFTVELSEKLAGFRITTEIVTDETKILRSKRGKLMMLVQNLLIKEN